MVYAAKIEIGWFDEWYTGSSACEIISKVEAMQDFNCLMYQGRWVGTAADQPELDKLEDFLNDYYDGSLKISDLEKLHICLSIGDFICHKVVKGSKKAVEQAMAEYDANSEE